MFAGELALDGRVRPIKGAIALAAMARASGAMGIVVPRDNAMEAAVVEGLNAPNLIVSFNDEGYLSRDQLVEMLSARGHVQVIEIARPRYVGARIGIHNPKGEKVGEVGRLRNVEHLFIVTDKPVELAASNSTASPSALRFCVPM